MCFSPALPSIRSPNRVTLPLVIGINPTSNRPMVDFPEPDFANQAQCLTVTNFEADAIDSTKQQFLASIAAYRKDLDEVLD